MSLVVSVMRGLFQGCIMLRSTSSVSFEAFAAALKSCVDSMDSKGLGALLTPQQFRRISQEVFRDERSMRQKAAGAGARIFVFNEGGEGADLSSFLSEFVVYVRHYRMKNFACAIESLSAALKRFTSLASHAEPCCWLLRPYILLCAQLRRMVVHEEARLNTERFSKRMVETFREIFSILHQEKVRTISLTCWVVCELLRLFFRVDQISLCGPMLSAMEQPLKDTEYKGFHPSVVPKCVAVTLFYLWGRYHVWTQRYRDACVKLEWALSHCLEGRHDSQIRHIAAYLMPCKMALGSLPDPSLIESVGLPYFSDFTWAIRRGDPGAYSRLLGKHMGQLLEAEIYLLMEKLKFLCYRNLVKRSFLLVSGDDPRSSNNIPLKYFRAALQLSEPTEDGRMRSEKECHCVLAGLLHIGALRGYISVEHDMFVFSKKEPFPKVHSWDW